MAKKKWVVDLDMGQNEVQNAVVQNLASAPGTPKEGQPYWNTADKKLYVFDGTNWVDATSQGKIYTFSTGLTETTGTVTLNEATTNALGGIIVGSNLSVNSGTLSVPDASDTAKGAIEIATDLEASTGTATNLAVTPKQLATKVDTSVVGQANGVASLGADGKVPSGQLPSYVDDVIELNTMASSAPATCATGDRYYNTTTKLIYTATATDTWGTTGETPDTGVIYVTKDTNASYRWSGSDMINIANPISAATESTPGIAAIATQVECTTGTNDTKIVTPLKMATYTNGMAKKITAQNGSLTASGGVCTWSITNTLGTADVIVSVYEVATSEEVMCSVTVASGTVTIKINSASNIAANTYRAVIIG